MRPPAGLPDSGREFHQLPQDARAARGAGRIDPLLRGPQPVRSRRAARKCCRARRSQPLCAVLLSHDRKTDTLTAYATLGGELFDDFFRKYEMKLSLEVGPKAKNAVTEPGRGDASWTSSAATRSSAEARARRAQVARKTQEEGTASMLLFRGFSCTSLYAGQVRHDVRTAAPYSLANRSSARSASLPSWRSRNAPRAGRSRCRRRPTAESPPRRSRW